MLFGADPFATTALASIKVHRTGPAAGGGGPAGGGDISGGGHQDKREGEDITRLRNQTIRAIDKHDAATRLGRLGGLKGGQARANSLSGKARSEAARSAAQKRWDK